MRISLTRGALLLLAAGSIMLATGCSSPANRAAMTPQNMVVAKHHPQTLLVRTSGGAETGAMDSANVADADLKAAIEDAVTQSKLFKGIVQGSGGDYELSVSVTSLSKPLFGATFTVEMETAWSLQRTSDRSIVMRKSIQSTGTASMGDAFVGATRLRMAVENATRDGISRGLREIAELSL